MGLNANSGILRLILGSHKSVIIKELIRDQSQTKKDIKSGVCQNWKWHSFPESVAGGTSRLKLSNIDLFC